MTQINQLLPQALPKKSGNEVSSNTSTESWAISLRERYGTPGRFLTLFNPGKQALYCRDRDRCFDSGAPSLNRVQAAYSREIAESWVEAQIFDLTRYTGIKEKPSNEHIESCASVIVQEYGYLKITELMLFFHRFKAGMFGRFYGTYDNLVLMDSLRQFVDYRNKELRRIEQEKARATREEEYRRREQEAVSYQEWIEMSRQQTPHSHE